MKTVSEYFKLNKSQLELDFVDVFINKNQDLPLFIDPWAIHIRSDERGIKMYNLINEYFQKIVTLIHKGHEDEARELLSHAIECKEIKLGVGKGGFGKGMGGKKYMEEIIKSLKKSKAVKTGIIKDIEDMILVIDGICFDRISDLIANILKLELIKYTEEQCELMGIPTRKRFGVEIWDGNEWNDLEECNLPYIEDSGRLILVPRAIVRKGNLSINSERFYDKYIIPYEKAKHLNAGSSLCRILKNGEKKEPTKEDIKSLIGVGKQINEKYISNYPELLNEYKRTLNSKDYDDNFLELFDESLKGKEGLEKRKEKEKAIVSKLIKRFSEIKPGRDDEAIYHNFIIGCLIYIFHPHLQFAKKEYPMNDGLKRIDISVSNCANTGFFASLGKRGIPCYKIYFECKNYRSELGNKEYDQLIGRFTDNVTRVGFIVARSVEDKVKMQNSLKYPALHQNAFMYVLTDEIICKFMQWKSEGKMSLIDNFLEEEFEKLIG